MEPDGAHPRSGLQFAHPNFAARLLKGAAMNWNRIEGNWKHWTSCTARKVQERYGASATTLYARVDDWTNTQ
jgi:hypothetical protein